MNQVLIAVIRFLDSLEYLFKSRKSSQIENLSDCLNRMWIRSDIMVRTAIPNKLSFRSSESPNRFKGPFPLQSFADYYLNELVVD